jgi:hypothetical protein
MIEPEAMMALEHQMALGQLPGLLRFWVTDHHDSDGDYHFREESLEKACVTFVTSKRREELS